MKKTFFWLLLVVLCAASGLQAQEFEWVRGIGSSTYDGVVDLKTDDEGNAYVLYSASGALTIGSQTMDLGNAASGFALAKHRPNGDVAWVGHFHTTFGWGEDGRPLPSSGSVYNVRLVHDGSGALYVAGSVGGKTEWIGPAGPETNTVLIARGQVTPLTMPSDIFLMKLDADGRFLWRQLYGGDGQETLIALAARGGTVAISGSYLVYGGGPIGNFPLPTERLGNCFVAALDGNGAPRWVRTAHSDIHLSYENGLDVAADGTVWYGVAFLRNIVWDGREFTHSNPSEKRLMLARLNTDGAVLWAKKVECPTIFSLVADEEGNAYASGPFGGNLFAGLGSVLIDQFEVRGRNEYLAKFDANGTALWANPEGAMTLALGPGGLYGAGAIFQERAIGGTVFRATGTVDAYAVRWDSDGTVQWARAYSDREYENAAAVAAAPAGDVWIGGRAERLNGAGIFNVQTFGGADAFLARFAVGGPKFLLHPKSWTVGAETDVVMEVVLENPDGAIYQWLRGGVPLVDSERIAGATTARLQINAATVADEGEYAVQVRTPSGVAVSGAGRLRVEGLMRFVSLEQFGDRFRLTFEGQAGRPYDVEYSADLKNWSFLTNGLTLASGSGSNGPAGSNALGRMIADDWGFRHPSNSHRIYRAVSR